MSNILLILLILGTLARSPELVWFQISFTSHSIYNLSTRLGYIHPAIGSQVQQSSNHQIHVISNISYFLNAASYDCWHNAIVSRTEAKSITILVRMGSSDNAKWIVIIRTYESQ